MNYDFSKVEYSIECLPEETSVKGNALASGDDAQDKEAEDWILAELDRGNEWAWCTVKVTATLGAFRGVDYLGCCSYHSEADFCQPGQYFEDMKGEALDDLKRNIAAVESDLSAIKEG